MNNTMKDLWRDKKGQVLKVVVVVILIVTGIFVYMSKNKSSKDIPFENITTEDSNKTGNLKEKKASDDNKPNGNAEDIVICDVSGEVKSPKVCELKNGDRIEDAIKSCGGLTEKADITTVNRAQIVKDGEKIIIPKKGDKSEGSNASAKVNKNKSDSNKGNGSTENKGKININIASSSELQKLNGVGPALAKNIISYRESKGKFSSIEDLKKVKGIGDKKFSKIKDKICI